MNTVLRSNRQRAEWRCAWCKQAVQIALVAPFAVLGMFGLVHALYSMALQITGWR